MNSRKEIISRNRKYLEEYLHMTENEWLEFLKNVGKPLNNFGKEWTPENPSRGWCAGVTKSLRWSGKIADGYIPCKNKQDTDGHFYMINPITNEVIDLTIYQLPGEYPYDYSDYSKSLGRTIFSKNIKKMFNALDLKLDKTKFILNRKNNLEFICSVK